jgi:hypothetical protein
MDGVFAPPAADEAILHLEELLTNMANDKLSGWFMQTVQYAELMALVKAEKKATETVADHRLVHIPNTLAKVGDKAMLDQWQAEYVKEMMPQQVGVGVKFAAELLAMGLRMTMHLHKEFIIISIDMINAYNEVKRATVMDAHSRHTYLERMIPYWRAKLSPTSKLWAGRDSMEHHEGLVQGSPISSSGFSFTIDKRVKEADGKMAAFGGCARFGIDDGYMVGPPAVVFKVLADFAASMKTECGCELNMNKCKMFSLDDGAYARVTREGHIPEEFRHLQEETYVNCTGEIMKAFRSSTPH